MSLIRSLKSNLLKLFNKSQIQFINANKVQKILVLKYDKIGDMIVATPLFREIKRNMPQAELVVLASKINKPLIEKNRHIDDILVYENNWINLFPTLLKLRKLKFDICIELEANFVSRAFFITKIVNSKNVVSISKTVGRYGLSADDIKVYDYYAPKKQSSHCSSIILSSLSVFGITKCNDQYEINVDNLYLLNAKKYFEKLPKRKLNIGINVKGQSVSGEISNNSLVKMFKEIYKINPNINIVMLTTPCDYEKVNIFIESLNLNYVFNSNFNIPEVASFISMLDLIVSPDTSVVHIAGAYNIPIVAIYSNEDAYNLWSPRSDITEIIYSNNQASIAGFSDKDLINKIKKVIMNLMK